MASGRPVRGARRRDGFSLVEVVISMSLLAIVMILLSTLALAVSRRGRINDLTTKRNFALAQQAGRIEALPFTEVAKLTSGTTQMLLGDFTFNRKLTVSNPAVNRYRVTIVVQPITTEFKADSITLDRTRPATGTPLCTTC